MSLGEKEEVGDWRNRSGSTHEGRGVYMYRQRYAQIDINNAGHGKLGVHDQMISFLRFEFEPLKPHNATYLSALINTWVVDKASYSVGGFGGMSLFKNYLNQY